ncbi:MAG: helix-turn-helix domain-containing protein [Parvibaculum sp.]
MLGHKEEIGHALRDARQAAGLTLKDIADAIRIRPIYLQAIEGGQFELLPALPQTVGFTRAYAKYLHVDVEQPLSRLGEEVHRDIENTDYSEPDLPWSGVSVKRIAWVAAGAVAGGVFLASMMFDVEPPRFAVMGRPVAETAAAPESLLAPAQSRAPRTAAAATDAPRVMETAPPARLATLRSASFRSGAPSAVGNSSVNETSSAAAETPASSAASPESAAAAMTGPAGFARQSVYLRALPANEGEVVGVLNGCEQVSLLGRDSSASWREVGRADGTTGWVYGRFVGDEAPAACL